MSERTDSGAPLIAEMMRDADVLYSSLLKDAVGAFSPSPSETQVVV